MTADLGELERLARAIFANPDRRMDAYYYGFDPTGVVEIDALLSAVASAGKAYHHTSDWAEFTLSPTQADVIQAVANMAAGRLRAALPHPVGDKTP